MAKKVIPKEYLYSRIARESGVPKVTVRKVMRALPHVIYMAMAKCERIQIGTGIMFEGVKNDTKKNYHDPISGEIKENTVFIRPRCIFNFRTKEQILKAYEEYQERLKQKEKEIEEKRARGYYAED